MQAIILAGGFGTRMRPLTLATPKPILPIGNIPFLVRQINHLKQHGVDEVIICLQYLPEQIQQVISREIPDITVHYALEDTPLGTAGALKNAEEYFGNQPIVVCNGDILTDLDLSLMLEQHRAKQAEATIATTRVSDPTAFGLVISDSSTTYISQFLEKPATVQEALKWTKIFYINAGTYMIEPEVLKSIPAGRAISIERETFPGLLAEGHNLTAFSSDAYWLDLGTPDKYLRAHQDLLTGQLDLPTRGDELAAGILAGQGCKIGNNFQAQGFVCLGDNVSLGDNCQLEDVVILSDTQLGANCTLRSSVVGSHVTLNTNCQLNAGSVIGDFTKLF
jgi:NDP-sugar pyrophosphorylase family protein